MGTQDAYRPLSAESQEIRLLIVQPGLESDMVHCSFEYCHLLNATTTQEYETISYVWGDSTATKPIRLDDERIEVPASSERALRRMRYTDRQRVLWIDAVCINQKDIQERSSQVAFMDQVYSHGKKNLIWLGEGDETTPTAVKCLYEIVDEMKSETHNFETAKSVLLDAWSNPMFSSSGLSLVLTPEEQRSISKFYASQWFQRVWILQEVALANCNAVYCGETECHFDLILKAAIWLMHKAHFLPKLLDSGFSGFRQVQNIADFCDHDLGYYMLPSSGYVTFLDLLNTAGQFQASQDRDYVFGLLGLAKKFTRFQGDPARLLPDYTKSLANVFTDAALYCIKERQNLMILVFVQHPSVGPSVCGLPTWVPQWGQEESEDHHPTLFSGQAFRACSTICFDWDFNMANLEKSFNKQIQDAGIVMGEIDVCSMITTDDIWTQAWPEEHSDMQLRLLCGEYRESVSFKSDPAMWPMTLTAGMDSERRGWSKGACEQAAATYDKMMRAAKVSRLDGQEREDLRVMHEYRNALGALCRRRIFTTRDGRIGLGPKDAMPGDTVAILLGFTMPVVLRRVYSGSNQFTFIGACYLYGIMDGEAVDEHRAAGRDFDEFVLV